MESAYDSKPGTIQQHAMLAEEAAEYLAMSPAKLTKHLEKLEATMYEHAKNLEFEEAAKIRDKIDHLKNTAWGEEGQRRI